MTSSSRRKSPPRLQFYIWSNGIVRFKLCLHLFSGVGVLDFSRATFTTTRSSLFNLLLSTHSCLNPFAFSDQRQFAFLRVEKPFYLCHLISTITYSALHSFRSLISTTSATRKSYNHVSRAVSPESYRTKERQPATRPNDAETLFRAPPSRRTRPRSALHLHGNAASEDTWHT